jgi:hypothetical protein
MFNYPIPVKILSILLSYHILKQDLSYHTIRLLWSSAHNKTYNGNELC